MSLRSYILVLCGNNEIGYEALRVVSVSFRSFELSEMSRESHFAKCQVFLVSSLVGGDVMMGKLF